MNFINIIGIVFALALLIPNVKFPLQKQEKLTFSQGAALTGFYGCLLLLGFNFGILELEETHGGIGMDYVALFYVWVAVGALLCGGYVVCYLFAYRTRKPLLRGLLPAIAFLLFLLSGVMLGHLLFYPFALLYAGASIPLLFKKRADAPSANVHEESESGSSTDAAPSSDNTTANDDISLKGTEKE